MLISNYRVCKSAAGYYMGCLYVCNEDFPGSVDDATVDEQGQLTSLGFPYSRDSDYFATREDCQRYIDQFE